MATKAKKSWQEKLKNDKNLPKVVKIKGKLAKRWGRGTVATPAPREVDQIMKKVPKGKLITINQIREKIAKKHKATMGCPICTGIFARISAGAAEELRAEGKKNTTPYWRTLKEGGVINEKYPGGVAGQKKLLTREGHKTIQKRKKRMVVNFEKQLIKL